MKIRNNIQTGLNTYASYSVSGMVNQNLSGVSITRLKLTGNTTYNFGTASTSTPYSYIVDAATYSFNLGTYSNYKLSPSDFPILGATGVGLSGSFTLNGLFDGSSMWIKSQLGFFDMPIPSGGGGGLDTDFLAFKSRVEADGGSLSATEITATNQLVVDLKAYGIWTSMKAVYPMVGASTASCKQNLKSSSFTGTFSSGWTFASTGVTPDGANGGSTLATTFNTGLNALSNLSLNSTHLSFYSRTNIVGSQVDMGAVDGTNGCYLIFNFGGTGYSSINDSESTRTTPASNTTGLLIASRNSSTQEKYFLNNTSQTRTSTSTTIPDAIITISGYRLVDSRIFYPNTKECAFASIGDGFDDTQASNFYTSVQAFQTTLSRQL